MWGRTIGRNTYSCLRRCYLYCLNGPVLCSFSIVNQAVHNPQASLGIIVENWWCDCPPPLFFLQHTRTPRASSALHTLILLHTFPLYYERSWAAVLRMKKKYVIQMSLSVCRPNTHRTLIKQRYNDTLLKSIAVTLLKSAKLHF